MAIMGSWTPGSRFPGVPTGPLLPFVVGGSSFDYRKLIG